MAMPGVRRHLGAGRRFAMPDVIATSGSKPEGDPEVRPSPPPRLGSGASDIQLYTLFRNKTVPHY